MDIQDKQDFCGLLITLKLSYAMEIGSLMLDRLGQPADAGYAGRFQG